MGTERMEVDEPELVCEREEEDDADDSEEEDDDKGEEDEDMVALVNVMGDTEELVDAERDAEELEEDLPSDDSEVIAVEVTVSVVVELPGPPLGRDRETDE
jgi:hypothetical protein